MKPVEDHSSTVISLIRKQKVYYLVAIRKSLNGLNVIYGLFILEWDSGLGLVVQRWMLDAGWKSVYLIDSWTYLSDSQIMLM